MTAPDLTPARLEALVIDVEGADQDGAMVAWEYTATGMRFTIRGALAAALSAQAERADAALARAEKAGEVLQDMLDDCEPDRPGAPRLSIREAARALAAHLAAARTELEPDA
jgi:dTDP-4-amino-4,6-dideoxygalactose transaminase